MADLLTSIPGDIPGLLLRGSPVLVLVDSDGLAVVRGVVLDPSIEPNEVDPRCLVWNDRNGRDNKAQMFVRLDLTDATGRAHAAWWMGERPISLLRAAADVGPHALGEIMDAARRGGDMPASSIDTLARLVLRLAGRS